MNQASLIDYPLIKVPFEMEQFVVEIVNGFPTRRLPRWNGIIVYHPASNSYYSTKVKDPLIYEENVRGGKGFASYNNLALVLRRLLDQHALFQLFVVPYEARVIVEQWLSTRHQAKRVITLKGEAATTIPVLYKVSSFNNNFHRYVIAPHGETRENILKKVNAGIIAWLTSTAKLDQSVRTQLRTALRYTATTKLAVFEHNSGILETTYISNFPASHHSSISTKLNLEEVQKFVTRTYNGAGNF